MDSSTKTVMKRYGYCERMQQGRIPGLYSVPCQGCGKKITTDDQEEVGYVVTKRGSALFWHKGYEGRINDNKILRLER